MEYKVIYAPQTECDMYVLEDQDGRRVTMTIEEYEEVRNV